MGCTGSEYQEEFYGEEDMEELLGDIIYEKFCEDEDPQISVHTFESVGVMTYNRGLVLRLSNGQEFQLTIIQSK